MTIRKVYCNYFYELVSCGERPEHGKTTGFLVGSRDEIRDAEVEDIP